MKPDTQIVPHIYVITRKDLSFPVAAVQSSHAVIEATQAFYDPQTSPHPNLVFTAVQNEKELLVWAAKLSKSDIRFKIWQEPDLNNKPTAIASEPVYGSQRKFFRELKLLNCGK